METAKKHPRKFCEYCKKNISVHNLTLHETTLKHINLSEIAKLR